MTKRIFRAILLVALAVLLLSVGLLSVSFYTDYESRYRLALKQEALSIAHGLNAGLDGQDYLPALQSDHFTGTRLTWVAADGTVLYDSAADEATMENHLQREEIAGALRYGAGESVRYSSTLARRTLYYACRLENGTVLRVAGTQDSVLGIFLHMLYPAIVVVTAAALLALLLSYRVARRVVKPLNELDLEHPELAETYDELSPLLEKIITQNRQITGQMEELRRRQREFAVITEHMSEGLLIVDGRTNLLFSNPSARRLLQIQDAEGHSVLAVNRSEAFRQAVQDALEGRHAMCLLSLDGSVYQLVANPAFEHKKVAGAVLVLLDVTEKEERERLRREFTANVSHELRTPLTSISGFAELIRDGIARPEDVSRFAGTIYTEAQRLISLVSDILRLSQLDEGRVSEEKSVVPLDALAESVASRFQEAAKLRNITWETVLEPCAVLGVRQILDELIYNLCDNAVKYNREGGHVRLTVRQEGSDAVLSVADTGIGIAPAEQARVFERFYRVDKSHSRSVGGTGLGLSIVKHAAAFHHAQVRLESAPGEGTCVTVRFPAC